MRAQGIAANATPRAWRGQNKRPPRDSVHWADKRSDSYRLRKQVRGIAAEIAKTGTYRDPAGPRLAESRKAVLASWQGIAKTLDDQGEIELAGSVRYFVSQLPEVRTDREKLAIDFIAYVNGEKQMQRREDRVRDQRLERTR